MASNRLRCLVGLSILLWLSDACRIVLAQSVRESVSQSIATRKERVEELRNELLELEENVRESEGEWSACATGPSIGTWRHRVKKEKEVKLELWNERDRVLDAGTALEDVFFWLSEERNGIERRLSEDELESSAEYRRVVHVTRNYYYRTLDLYYVPSFEEYVAALGRYLLSIENATRECRANEYGSAWWDQFMSYVGEMGDGLSGVRRTLDRVFSLIDDTRRAMNPESTKTRRGGRVRRR